MERPVCGELGVGAAIVAERIDQPRERGLDLRDDPVLGHVREPHSEIGQQPLEGEPLGALGAALRVLGVRSPGFHYHFPPFDRSGTASHRARAVPPGQGGIVNEKMPARCNHSASARALGFHPT